MEVSSPICIYIIYTPNLRLKVTVLGREREQGRFKGSTEGARGRSEGAPREHGGAPREHWGAAREHWGAAREHWGVASEQRGRSMRGDVLAPQKA